MSILLAEPFYLETGNQVFVTLDNGTYLAKLKVQIVYVNMSGNRWNYSMKILDYLNTYDDYLQMLYDRVPRLPQEIQKDSGSFDDLKLNMKNRVTSPFYQKRKSPRILLDTMVNYYIYEATDSKEVKERMEPTGKIKLHDFNYYYACLDSVITPEHIVIQFTEGIRFDCTYKTQLSNGYQLYQVVNYEEVVSNPLKLKQLAKWLQKNNVKAIERQEQIKKKHAIEKKELSKNKDFEEINLIN